MIALFDGNLNLLDQKPKIDSGYFSRQLARALKNLFDKDKSKSLTQLMTEAVSQNEHEGSSTYCVAVFDETNKLVTQTLGDTAYMILRPDGQDQDTEFEVVFKTKTLSLEDPETLSVKTAEKIKESAQNNVHEVKENDIVLMGVNTIFLNLFQEDITDCIQSYMTNYKVNNLQKASLCIINLTERMYSMQSYKSPAYLAAKEAGKDYPQTGVVDDATVILAQIHPAGKGYSKGRDI